MDSRYHPNVINCVRDKGQPPQGYECCTQEVDHLNKPVTNKVYGLYVKKGECDPTTGLVRRSGNSSGKISRESFEINSMEGYNINTNTDECKNWKGAFWVLVVVIFVMLFIILNVTLNRRR